MTVRLTNVGKLACKALQVSGQALEAANAVQAPVPQCRGSLQAGVRRKLSSTAWLSVTHKCLV